MMQKLMDRRNRKGFTLIELIVVIAIIAILAAVAIPRFAELMQTSKIKADATTAQLLVNAARIQETDTGTAVATDDPAVLDPTYGTVTAPQSGGAFAISGGGADPYVIKWTPTNTTSFTKEQIVTENAAFTISK